MVAADFLSHYMSGPLPYVRRHITVNKNVLSVSLNKPFPTFLRLYGTRKMVTDHNEMCIVLCVGMYM